MPKEPRVRAVRFARIPNVPWHVELPSGWKHEAYSQCGDLMPLDMIERRELPASQINCPECDTADPLGLAPAADEVPEIERAAAQSRRRTKPEPKSEPPQGGLFG